MEEPKCLKFPRVSSHPELRYSSSHSCLLNSFVSCGMKISLCIKPHCEDIAIKNIHADNKYDVIFACVSGKTVRTRSLVFQFSQCLVPSLKCIQTFIRFQLTKIDKVSSDLKTMVFSIHNEEKESMASDRKGFRQDVDELEN